MCAIAEKYHVLVVQEILYAGAGAGAGIRPSYKFVSTQVMQTFFLF
jgi:hypothetical protein